MKLPMEWRDELNVLLDAVIDNREHTTRPARARAVLDLLRDATQAHRPWADAIIEEALIAGLARIIKQREDSRARVLVATTTGTVERKASRAVMVVDREGNKVVQQKLIQEFTWDHLDQHDGMLGRQIGNLADSRRMVARLMELRERFPDTTGPAEACARLGLTVDEFLAQPERKAS